MGQEVVILHYRMVSLAFPLSLLFLLTLFGVSFSTSMAKLPSNNGENPAKRTSAFSCIYGRQSFRDHRSLGGHHRSHNVGLKSAWKRNCPGSSSTSIGSNNQPGNSCEGVGNNLAFLNESSSKLTIPVNTTCAGFGSTPATGFPSDVSLSLGLKGVQKLSTNEGQTCHDGKPFSYGGVLQNSQHNLSRGGGCLLKMDGFLTSEEGKKIYSFDSIGNTDVMKRSRKRKIVSNLPVEIEKPEIKELPRVKVMEKEKPFSALLISADAEQEIPADIDLSLHL